MNDELADRLADAPDFDEDTSPLEPPAPPRQPSQVYSLRIPVEKLELLRMVAAESNETPSALMRRWILEYLSAAVEDGRVVRTSAHLVDRVIELEQQVAAHQKALQQQAVDHEKEFRIVVEKVIDAIEAQFDIRPKSN